MPIIAQRKIHCFILLIISLLAYAPARDCAKASGVLLQSAKSLKGFSGVEVGNAVAVKISRADTFSVVIEADSCAIKEVTVVQEGAILRISQKSSLPNSPGASIILTMPDLRFIKASGASQVTADSFSSQDNIIINLEGASSFHGSFACPRMQAVASGASFAIISGRCGKLHGEASEASFLHLGSLFSRSADIIINGASSGCVSASDSLAVDIGGASQVRYSGNPIMTGTKITGASLFEKSACE